MKEVSDLDNAHGRTAVGDRVAKAQNINAGLPVRGAQKTAGRPGEGLVPDNHLTEQVKDAAFEALSLFCIVTNVEHVGYGIGKNFNLPRGNI